MSSDWHTRNAADLFNVPERDVTQEQRLAAKLWAYSQQYGFRGSFEDLIRVKKDRVRQA